MFLAVMIICLLVVNEEVQSFVLVKPRIRLRSKREVETKLVLKIFVVETVRKEGGSLPLPVLKNRLSDSQSLTPFKQAMPMV